MKRPMIVMATLAAVVSGSVAQAETIAALVGDDMIATVDAKAGKVQGMTKIDGLSSKVLGIDVRPADGMLYAVTEDGTVATVDPKTGKATKKATLEMTLPAGVKAVIDFNPVADRLRVMGSDGTNLRANVDDGKVVKDGTLKFAETDANKGASPMVVAGAYTNSMKGAKETGLYNVDAKLGTLVKQAPPNDGVLNTIGSLGVTGKALALDVKSDGNGGNVAYLMAGDALHTVDLATGKVSKARKIDGAASVEVRDIAVLAQ